MRTAVLIVVPILFLAGMVALGLKLYQGTEVHNAAGANITETN